MTLLHAVKNDTAGRGYCGPIAVAAITGKPLSKVLDTFRDVMHPVWRIAVKRGERVPNIKGTWSGGVAKTLALLGWRMDWVPVRRFAPLGKGWATRPTLAAFIRLRKGDDRTATFLLSVGGRGGNHWVVVRGRKFVDTHTKGVPVNTGKAPHRRKRVHEVYRIERLNKKGSA